MGMRHPPGRLGATCAPLLVVMMKPISTFPNLNEARCANGSQRVVALSRVPVPASTCIKCRSAESQVARKMSFVKVIMAKMCTGLACVLVLVALTPAHFQTSQLQHNTTRKVALASSWYTERWYVR